MSHTKRTLIESFAIDSQDGPALKVDERAGVIHGVKILGRFSRNSHGAHGVTKGTEYSTNAMRDAIPLYEGSDVIVDHPDRNQLNNNRSSRDVFGKIRNVRLESDELRGDLHYLKSDPFSAKVIEDVKRRLGVFGLSHNAASGRERVEGGRLIIESIDLVRSVDLVRKPATNRNLWESDMSTENKPETKKHTLRTLLESQGKRFSANRKLWADTLLEMDEMSDAVGAPVEIAADVEPDDALWSGFKAAIMSCMDKYESGEYDSTACLAKIKDLLKTHEKLDSDDEPEAPTESDDTGSDDDKTESLKGADAKELELLRRKEKVRNLCEGLEFIPSKPQLTALVAMESDKDRRELIEELKTASPVAKTGVRTVRSGRTLTESQQSKAKDPAATAERLNRLRSY